MDVSTVPVDRPRTRFGVLAGGLSAVLLIGVAVVVVQLVTGAMARVYTVADLEGIILADADAPAGTEPDISGSGRALLETPVWYLSPSERQRFRDLAGFVDGRENSFRGPVSEGDLLYVSQVFLFENATEAQAAIDAYAAEWQDTFGFADPAPDEVSLGDGGVLFAGPAEVQGGEPGFYYLWRMNTLMLTAVGIGDVEGERLEELGASVEAIATEMQRRTQGG